MANKHRIEDIDAALEQSLRKLSMLVTRINELRRKRRAIAAGRMKQPPPAGVKKLIALHKAGEFSFDDDVSDIGERPIAPGGAGPCAAGDSASRLRLPLQIVERDSLGA